MVLNETIRVDGRKKKMLIPLCLFFAGVIFHFLLSNYGKKIGVYPDDLRYYGIARSLFNGTGLTLRNANTGFQKIFYSIFLLPTFIIRNSLVRVQVICLINSVLITSAVFPAWLIADQCELDRTAKIFFSCILMVWPDMLMAATFMPESLYWPVLMWSIYLWVHNQKKGSPVIAIIEGAVCYIGYMTKEVFLAVFVAYFLFELSYPVICAFSERKLQLRDGHFYSFSEKNSWIPILCYAATFILCHIVVKSLFFKGLANSYNNQTGISAVLAPYPFVYLFYSFVYYLAAEIIACMVVPFVIPYLKFQKMKENSRKLFVYLFIILILCAGIVAYTISVREDLGKLLPRVHLRYVGPVIALFIMFPLISYDDNSSAPSRKRRTLGALAVVVVLVLVAFKGIGAGSRVDQLSLGWYQMLQQRIGILQAEQYGEMPIYMYVIAADCVIAIVCGVYYLLARKGKTRQAKYFYSAIMFAACIISCIHVYGPLKDSLYADKSSIEEIESMDEYFQDIGEDETKLYISNVRGMTSESRLMDIYFDDVDGLYMVDAPQIGYAQIGKEKAITEMDLREPIWQTPYGEIDHIDYIILEDAIDLDVQQIDNLEEIESQRDGYFRVFKNLQPSILATRSHVQIWFGGEKYNALDYVVEGISGTEGDYSWTDGDVLRIQASVLPDSDMQHVTIYIIGTFNGNQSYIIKDKHGNIVLSDSIEGNGTIEFDIKAEDGNVDFSVDLENAIVVNSVMQDSTDNRKIALQVNMIDILEVK